MRMAEVGKRARRLVLQHQGLEDLKWGNCRDFECGLVEIEVDFESHDRGLYLDLDLYLIYLDQTALAVLGIAPCFGDIEGGQSRSRSLRIQLEEPR